MTPTTICQGFIGVNTPQIWNILLFCVHVEHAGHTRISVWFWSRVCYYRLTGPNSVKHVKSESRFFQYPLLILTFHFHTTKMNLTCFNLDWTVGKQDTMLLRTNAFFLLSILEMVCDLCSVQQKTNFIHPSHLIFFAVQMQMNDWTTTLVEGSSDIKSKTLIVFDVTTSPQGISSCITQNMAASLFT